jgi:Holliday junction resolvase RusA-like endonuclease
MHDEKLGYDRVVRFFVPSRPVTQGNHRANRNGGLRETSRGHKEWRSAVVLMASRAWRGREPMDCAAKLIVYFYVPLIKSTKKGDWPHRSGGDTDKLVRSICDALESAGVVTNDRRITDIVARRRFAFDGPVGAHIAIGPVF